MIQNTIILISFFQVMLVHNNIPWNYGNEDIVLKPEFGPNSKRRTMNGVTNIMKFGFFFFTKIVR